jgi:chromate transporter
VTSLADSDRLGAEVVAGFIRGVGVTVVGVLVGTTWLVGRSAIGDWVTIAIFAGALLALLLLTKLPEPLVIAAGAAVGLLAYRAIDPQWLLR